MDRTVIQKCYRKCGILDKDFNVVQQVHLDADPFCDLDTMPGDEVPQLPNLIQKTCGGNECLYNDDVDIPMSFDLDDEHWQDKFLKEIGFRGEKHCKEDQEDSDDEAEPQPSEAERTRSIKTSSNALVAIKDLSTFLQIKGHTTEANEVIKFSSQVTRLYHSELSLSR